MITFFINIKSKYSNLPEIHQYGCRYLQKFNTEKTLGSFEKLSDAVLIAKKTFPEVTKCDTCCLGMKD